MKTKRVAIAELEVHQVQWVMNTLCEKYHLKARYARHEVSDSISRKSCLEAIRRHNPSGYVEVPEELVEEE